MIDWNAVADHARQQQKKLFPSPESEVTGELKRRFALTIDLKGHYQDWKEIGFDNIAHAPKEERYKLNNEEQVNRHQAAQKAIEEQRSKRSAKEGDGGSSE